MTKLLPILLEAQEHAGPERRKELAAMVDPKMVFEFDEGVKKSVRELIMTTGTESTSLVQAEVHRTIIEGSKPAVCMRNAINVINCNSNSLRVNYGAAGVYAPEVAGGSAIPDYNNTYTARNFEIHKYGYAPLITRELVDDGLFDVINQELMFAGQACENTLNKVTFDSLLANSGQAYDAGTTAANLGLASIASAMGTIKGVNYMPTDVIMAPAFEGLMLRSYTPAGGYYQTGDTGTTGVLPKVLGLNAHTLNVTYGGGTYTWGYGTDNYIGALVVDRYRAGAIALREDTRVEQYNDPIHDLIGIKTTIRFDGGYIAANASCRCQY